MDDLSHLQAKVAGLQFALVFLIGKSRQKGLLTEAEVEEFKNAVADQTLNNPDATTSALSEDFMAQTFASVSELFGNQHPRAA